MITGVPVRVSPTVLLAAAFAVVSFAGSPVATKVAVTTMSPLAVVLLRTVLASLAAAPLALALRLGLPVDRRQRGTLALSAVSGFVAFPILFTVGQRYTSAAHGALILAALPVFGGAYAALWERRWPSRRWWVGCVIALVGEGLLIGVRQGFTSGSVDLFGDALVLASTLLVSLGYVGGGRLAQAGYNSWGTTFWGLSLAGLVLLPVFPWAVGGTPWGEVGSAAWIAVGYLGVGVLVVGYAAWYWALGLGGIARISLFQFFQPLVGVVLARVLLRESLTAGLLAATAVIMSGVVIAQRSASPAPSSLTESLGAQPRPS